jgi:protein-tyrosine-phosphatase
MKTANLKYCLYVLVMHSVVQYVKHFSKKLGPDLEVDSAGTKITSKITKEAREYLMSEDAIQYLKKTPESIDSKQVEQHDIIIAMEQRYRDSVLKKCPECKNKVVVWDVR